MIFQTPKPAHCMVVVCNTEAPLKLGHNLKAAQIRARRVYIILNDCLRSVTKGSCYKRWRGCSSLLCLNRIYFVSSSVGVNFSESCWTIIAKYVWWRKQGNKRREIFRSLYTVGHWCSKKVSLGMRNNRHISRHIGCQLVLWTFLCTLCTNIRAISQTRPCCNDKRRTKPINWTNLRANIKPNGTVKHGSCFHCIDSENKL